MTEKERREVEYRSIMKASGAPSTEEEPKKPAKKQTKKAKEEK